MIGRRDGALFIWRCRARVDSYCLTEIEAAASKQSLSEKYELLSMDRCSSFSSAATLTPLTPTTTHPAIKKPHWKGWSSEACEIRSGEGPYFGVRRHRGVGYALRGVGHCIRQDYENTFHVTNPLSPLQYLLYRLVYVYSVGLFPVQTCAVLHN